MTKAKGTHAVVKYYNYHNSEYYSGIIYVQIFEGRKFRCFYGQLVIHEILIPIHLSHNIH